MSLGTHRIIDLYNINVVKVKNINKNNENKLLWQSFIYPILIEANVTLIDYLWHDFNTDGSFTALYLLAESHISIHTWPENNYIALDVFTCGQGNTQLIVDKLIHYFEPLSVSSHYVTRGNIIKKELIENTEYNPYKTLPFEIGHKIKED
jgi:S-adenosylmethionine decarboxylase proenzyme